MSVIRGHFMKLELTKVQHKASYGEVAHGGRRVLLPLLDLSV
jgi:hypothetical protein